MRDWVNPVTCALATCAAILSAPAPAFAGDMQLQPGIFSDPEFEPTVTLGASVSRVSGQANEYVYKNDGNYKLSELNWKIENVVMLNAEVAVRLTPWLGFKLAGGTKLAGDSEMDDYDWIEPATTDWSHWSHHPDTTVIEANRADASANLSLFRHPNFSLDAIGGVRWNAWGFSAYGGHYIYTTETDGFRGSEGDFDSGSAGITYKQSLITPYLGLQVNLLFERFYLDASVSGSPFSFAFNRDEHHMRIVEIDKEKYELLFRDSMHNGSYVDYKIGGGWKYSDRVSITASWEREVFAHTMGSSTIYAQKPGTTNTIGLQSVPGKSAGYDNATDRVSLGLTYALD